MIWIDREDKTCWSVEDLDLCDGKDITCILRPELLRFDVWPVTAVGVYERLIPFKEHHTSGRFFCVGMGNVETVGKGGWRQTYLNSKN